MKSENIGYKYLRKESVILKCLCFSDSHGSSMYIEKALKLHPDTEVVFFLGDGLMDIERFVSRYNSIAFLAVRGNCDISSVMAGNMIAKTEAVTLLGKRIVYTHGDLYGVKYGEDGLIRLAESKNADVILFGHTHQPKEKYLPDNAGGIYLFNPGSIGISYGNAPSYGIMNITEKGIAFSHGAFL